MRKLYFIFGLLLLVPVVAHAQQNQSMEIAAIVNDDVISKLDIENRLSLVSLSSTVQMTEENRKKIYPQILRNLIDERLQLQEAKRLNIPTTEGEINSGVARLAQQNNVTPDKLEEFIQSAGGNYDSLLDQIKATIAWTKVVRQKFASTTTVTEDEINAEINKIKANQMAPQYQVSEIFLSVDNPSNEPEIQSLADRLVQEILNGAPFDSLARQFSQSASASEGGDLGWVKRGQLPDVVDQKIATMQPNQISKALRVNDGFVILFLRDVRTPAEGHVPEIDRQPIADMLRQKKLESAARKYLRDLRSLALVDLRS